MKLPEYMKNGARDTKLFPNTQWMPMLPFLCPIALHDGPPSWPTKQIPRLDPTLMSMLRTRRAVNIWYGDVYVEPRDSLVREIKWAQKEILSRRKNYARSKTRQPAPVASDPSESTLPVEEPREAAAPSPPSASYSTTSGAEVTSPADDGVDLDTAPGGVIEKMLISSDNTADAKVCSSCSNSLRELANFCDVCGHRCVAHLIIVLSLF